MSDTIFFTAPGTFWRGNLHTHSTLSDGVLSPAEVCRRYKAEGYDFIALTDHFVGLFDYPIADTVPFRDDEFTTLLGAELHSGAMENGGLWHILAVGLPPDFAPSDSPNFKPHPDQETGAQIARRARDAGAFVAIAHPEWSQMTTADAATIEAAHSVEVYNHGCAIECDRAHGHYTLDQLLTRGKRLSLCATDDAHFKGPDAFGGWVMVKSESNTPDALLAALKAGHHYATTGPEIHNITFHDNSVTVECSAAATVVVFGQGSPAAYEHGTDMTSATLKLAKVSASPWLRVTVIDKNMKRAWSNPVWR